MPIDRITKNELLTAVAGETGVAKGTVVNVVDRMFEIIADELSLGNEVVITKQVKFGFGITRAIRKGTPTRNPANGETFPHAGRPAGVKIRVNLLSDLKKAAPGPKTAVGKSIIAEKARK